MDYIVSNLTPKGEIRVSNREIEGKLLWSGHRLAMPDGLLPHILNYNYEKFKNIYYFLDYKKWKDIYNFDDLKPNMNQCWFNERDNNKALLKSYDTLLEVISEVLGDSKRIFVVEK